MTDFIIKQFPYELSNQAGLALIGKYLKRININSLVDPVFSVRSGIANSDILKSYIGLLCLGKNDFDAIESQRKDGSSVKTVDSGFMAKGLAANAGMASRGLNGYHR
jgi:hypothetical protein